MPFRRVPLKTIRRAAGLTQARLAQKAGVHQQLISRLESGQVRAPSHRDVILICRALNVDPQRVGEFALDVD